MSKVNTLHKLGQLITMKLRDGYALKDLGNSILSYNGTDWKRYMYFCKLGYKRNLVLTNDTIKIMVICWDKCQSSGIHDHPEGGCLVKLLQGELIEKIYKKHDNRMIHTSTNYLTLGTISYQEGKNGLHQIINDSNDGAVTLHIYSPPNYVPKFYN